MQYTYGLVVVATAAGLCRFLALFTTVAAFSLLPSSTTHRRIILNSHNDNVHRFRRCCPSKDASRWETWICKPLQMTSSGSDDEDEEDNDDSSSREYSSYSNPFDKETPEERKARMEQVRKLQKSFYKDETGPTLREKRLTEIRKLEETFSNDGAVAGAEPSQAEETSTTSMDASGAAVIENLPLWRVQWTEFPGAQNVLNVHVPHYTNMFQKILKGKIRQWDEEADDCDSDTNAEDEDEDYYFGHIFLEGGSENLDNPEYALQVGEIGTLMRICDARQHPDGRLTLVVQALERFLVKDVERSHSPYAIADVCIAPDMEQALDSKFALLKQDATTKTTTTSDSRNAGDEDQIQLRKDMAASRAFAYHPYEYRKVAIDECEILSATGDVIGLGVSPLSNYDATQQIPTLFDTCLDDFLQTAKPQRGSDWQEEEALSIRKVLTAESSLWMQVDELIKLLRIASNGMEVPVPSQIMGLLPRRRAVGWDQWNLQTEPWPANFTLGKIVDQWEEQNHDIATTKLVGTHSKSPFVRVDRELPENADDNDEETPIYSSLRRAQRLSFVVWTLTDSITLPMNEPTKNRYHPQSILGTASAFQRLSLAREKISYTCEHLKKVLRLRG